MVFILVLLIPLYAIAQTFTATVDETTIGDNQQFQISFTLSGQNLKGVRNLKPPSFSDFMALSGPSQSTNIQFINGVQSASYSYSYILRTKRIGVFTIGKASIEFNGKLYETEPIKITVVKGSSLPKQKKKDGQISNEEIAKNLFIRAIVNKKKVFLGEQVTVVYKLYTRLNIAAQMSINKLPQYQGFWTEELESSNNITFSTEMIDGKQFRVGTLKRAALFPTQTGKLEITPFELTVPIQLRRNRNRNNFFDDFFNDPFGASQTVKYNATSNKVTINVLPLPATGKPESFNGAVGDFTLNAGIDKTTAKTNESMTLKVSISGKGNLELLKLPKLDLPAGFEKYEPKTSKNINRKNVISGKKTAEYLMIPRVVGKREIPAIEFSYFNPEKKKYFTLRSKSFTLNITQGEKLIEAEFASKEDILKLGDDIRFIKTFNDDIYKKEESILFTTFFWTGGIVPVILLLILVGWKRKNDKLAGNLALLHYQRARKVAKSRLKKAKKLMQENNRNEFYTEISFALFGYLEDKFHIPKAEFTIDRAADELRKAGVEETLIETVKRTAKDCEFVRFSPGAEKDSAIQSIYDQLTVVIVDLEKNIAEGNGK